MYYELYLDVFFTVNFMMDSILLLLLSRMLKSQVRIRRVFGGALAGAALTCAVILLPIPYASVKFILFHVLVNVVMIITGLGIRWGRELVKAWVFLYISGFLLGGVFQFFRPYIRTGSLFFLLAVVSYYIVSGIWNLLGCLMRQNHYRCQVILKKGERQCQVEALIDTGNTLADAVTGKPVCIIDQVVAEEILGDGREEQARYIVYHSIGRENGTMLLVTLDEMLVYQEGEHRIIHPLAAVSEGTLSADKYKMILNPDVLIGGVHNGNKSSSAESV